MEILAAEMNIKLILLFEFEFMKKLFYKDIFPIKEFITKAVDEIDRL